MPSEMTSICLFRRDMRLTDNPALAAAAANGPVCAAFWVDAVLRAQGAASRWRVGEALKALDVDLRRQGGAMTVVEGDEAAVLALASAIDAREVHVCDWPAPARLEADRLLARTLEASGLRLVVHHAHTLLPPGAVQTRQGKGFRVFTPFSRAARTVGAAPPRPAPSGVCWIVPAGLPPGFAATIPDLAPDMDRGADVVNAHSPPAGEAAATTRLAQFISRSADYVAGRDRLDKQMAGSGLSDALAVGEISPRTVWAAAQDIACDPEHAPAAEKFMSELLWRDFAWSLLIEAPWMESKTWNPRFVGFPWREVREDLTAWQRGQTGEPLVDAGMRELFVTGRMHNRARMAAASYLTKHLLIDWRAGLDWFADTLMDWDPASNATNWQWVAGSGPDASPFFRIFNPATQAEKFDPDGVYRRRWLYGWQGSKSDGARAFFDAAPRSWGLDPSRGYDLRPIIGLAEGRLRALAAFEQV
ncbi:hypothetical protein IX57_11595 [Paracoccus sanguinis]|nr:hypothetical protein IX57_11595 [Paracoccus sanguinis]